MRTLGLFFSLIAVIISFVVAFLLEFGKVDPITAIGWLFIAIAFGGCAVFFCSLSISYKAAQKRYEEKRIATRKQSAEMYRALHEQPTMGVAFPKEIFDYDYGPRTISSEKKVG